MSERRPSGRGPDDDVAAPSTTGSPFTRRGFLQATGAAATAAGLGRLMGPGPAEAATPEAKPIVPPGQLKKRPNILLIMSDEYRYPVPYESRELVDFRNRWLTAETFLRNNGLEFKNHYIMSAACTPSRASIYTGQYPSLHGVSQTTGVAKSSFEQDMYWLDPATVPTMGSYFRAGGYQTFWKGKWHASDADILIPGTHSELLSFGPDGVADPAIENQYIAAARLDRFGFNGWVGPEPHGSNPLNSASSAREARGRDVKFADQTVALLQSLGQQKGAAPPWLVVSSFLNPHDISLWGEFTLQDPSFNLIGQLAGTHVPQHLFDDAQYAATLADDLRNKKPKCQASYVELYEKMFQPLVNSDEYRQFYYQMMQNVNDEIRKVLVALAANPTMANDTIVIFTADHGEMLGAHGDMHQKWYQAYEETVHVPFFVYNPVLTPTASSIDAITSHADLLPTMLGLAGIDPNAVTPGLQQDHTEVHPLVGRDLSKVILGQAGPEQITGAVYFMTDDDPSKGANQIDTTGEMYSPVVQPSHIETVVTMLPTGANSAMEKWKYSHYTDNPQFWTDLQAKGLSGSKLPPNFPNVGSVKDVETIVSGNVDQAGDKTAVTTTKEIPVDTEPEAYNVTRDPLELDNLVNSSDPVIQATLAQLEDLLHQQCQQKRLKPSSGEVPGQPDC